MNYIEKVLKEVQEKNPNEPEFNEAVGKVLESLKPVIEAHPEYEKMAILERLVEPERQIMFRVPWVASVFLGLTVMERFKLTVVTVFNLMEQSDLIKEDFVSTHLLI